MKPILHLCVKQWIITVIQLWTIIVNTVRYSVQLGNPEWKPVSFLLFHHHCGDAHRDTLAVWESVSVLNTEVAETHTRTQMSVYKTADLWTTLRWRGRQTGKILPFNFFDLNYICLVPTIMISVFPMIYFSVFPAEFHCFTSSSLPPCPPRNWNVWDVFTSLPLWSFPISFLSFSSFCLFANMPVFQLVLSFACSYPLSKIPIPVFPNNFSIGSLFWPRFPIFSQWFLWGFPRF